MKMNRFIFFIISLLVSLCNCCLLPAYFMQVVSYRSYSESLKLPSNGDSLGIPLAAALIIGTFFAIFHIFMHAVFLRCCFTKLKRRRIDLKEFLIHKKQKLRNVMRISGYAVMSLLIMSYIAGYFEFFIFEFCFYLTSVIITAVYIIWLSTLSVPERMPDKSFKPAA